MKIPSRQFIVLLSIIVIASCQTQRLERNTFRTSTTTGFGSNEFMVYPQNQSSCCDFNVIKVSGRGEVTSKPDIAVLSLTIQETEDTTQEAIQAVNRKIQQILRILDRSGIADSDIETQALNAFPKIVFQNGQSRVVGQTATQTLDAKVRQIGESGEDVGPIIDRLSIVNGVRVNNIRFELDDRSQEIEKAREEAFKDAKQKAKDYADFAGVRLHNTITIIDNARENSNPIPFPESRAAVTTGPDSTTIKADELTVSHQVTVTFSIY